LGGSGGVSASAHVATRSWVELVQACLSGDVALARELHEKVLPIVSTGFAEPNPVVFKGALAAMGEIETDFVRLPLIPAKKDSVEALVNVANSII